MDAVTDVAQPIVLHKAIFARGTRPEMVKPLCDAAEIPSPNFLGPTPPRDQRGMLDPRYAVCPLCSHRALRTTYDAARQSCWYVRESHQAEGAQAS